MSNNVREMLKAPEGYYAVTSDNENNCNGCAFYRRHSCSIPVTWMYGCVASEREDGMHVTFKKIEDSVRANTNPGT